MSSKKKGRPPDSILPRDNLVGLRLNSKELSSLEAYAFRYDQSVSEVVRDCLMILGVIPDDLPYRRRK